MIRILLLSAAVFATTFVPPASAAAPSALSQVKAEHLMVSTGDYEGTIAWYEDILGFETRVEWTVPEFPGVRLAYLELNGFLIEVVSTAEAMQDAQSPPDVAAHMSDRGFGHLSFITDDVDSVAEELRAKGITLDLEPTSFPIPGRRIIFLRDNNGNYIEFVTPLPSDQVYTQR